MSGCGKPRILGGKRLNRLSGSEWLQRLCAAGALALAGCSALPVITPDLARVDPASVQFQAANGRIVSPERSKELIAKLGGAQSSDVLARHLALEQAVADGPLVLGNRVVILENGPNTYAAMFSAIAVARDSINMETYILEDDEVGQRLADALIAKQQQGVQVNLIHDAVGTLGTKKEYFQRLSDAGVNVLEFNPVNPLAAKAGWDVNQRDHRKLLVVDGRTAVLEDDDPVAEDERTVGDGLLERQMARQDIAAVGAAELVDQLLAALRREDAAVGGLELDAGRVAARQVRRDHRQRAAACQRKHRDGTAATNPSRYRRSIQNACLRKPLPSLPAIGQAPASARAACVTSAGPL